MHGSQLSPLVVVVQIVGSYEKVQMLLRNGDFSCTSEMESVALSLREVPSTGMFLQKK